MAVITPDVLSPENAVACVPIVVPADRVVVLATEIAAPVAVDNAPDEAVALKVPDIVELPIARLLEEVTLTLLPVVKRTSVKSLPISESVMSFVAPAANVAVAPVPFTVTEPLCVIAPLAVKLKLPLVTDDDEDDQSTVPLPVTLALPPLAVSASVILPVLER